MGITTSKLIDEMWEHLGVGSQELSPDDALLLLNRSYWELTDKIPFRAKEVTATFVTAYGQRNYAVPTVFDALRQLSILDPNSNTYKVLKRDSVYSHEDGRSTSSDAYGFPEKYVREDDAIRLLPVPDNTYTITIKYWTSLDDLDASDSPVIPQIWHEIILYGALWRAWLRFRDFQAVNQYKMQQLALINSSTPVEAKEETDSHTSGLQVLGKDYP